MFCPIRTWWTGGYQWTWCWRWLPVSATDSSFSLRHRVWGIHWCISFFIYLYIQLLDKLWCITYLTWHIIMVLLFFLPPVLFQWAKSFASSVSKIQTAATTTQTGVERSSSVASCLTMQQQLSWWHLCQVTRTLHQSDTRLWGDMLCPVFCQHVLYPSSGLKFWGLLLRNNCFFSVHFSRSLSTVFIL